MKRPRDPEKVFASRPHSVGFLVGVPLSFVVGLFLFFFVGRLCHIVRKKIKDKIDCVCKSHGNILHNSLHTHTVTHTRNTLPYFFFFFLTRIFYLPGLFLTVCVVLDFFLELTAKPDKSITKKIFGLDTQKKA